MRRLVKLLKPFKSYKHMIAAGKPLPQKRISLFYFFKSAIVLRTPTLRVGSQFRIPKSAIDLLQKVGPFLIAPSFCGTISGVYSERNGIYSFAMVEGV